MVELWFVTLIIVIAIMVFIKKVKFYKSLLHSFVESMVLVLVIWINIPCFAIIPEGVEVSGLYNYNFYLFEKLGWIYILLADFSFIIVELIYNVNFNKRYTEKDIIKEFDKHIIDADKLYLVGRKLNFMSLSKLQRDSIENLKDRCNILCCDSNESLETYKKLIDNKVGVKVFNDDNCFINLRGQIKKDHNGKWSALFVEKQKEFYKSINIDNQNLINVMLETFKDLYKEGKNPLIKCIALDLGGVYFDGSYNNFLEKISDMCSNISTNYVDNLVLDEDLNLGKKDICEFIEDKIGKTLAKKDQNKIKQAWNNNWKPNREIQIIMNYLYNNLNYSILPFSNLDKSNGEEYLKRNYFKGFLKRYYFSYQLGMTKPLKKFFVRLQDNEKLKPFQILLIDDRQENIEVAKDCGWDFIKFENSDKESYKRLINNLTAKSIINVVDKQNIMKQIEDLNEYNKNMATS